MIIQCVYHCFCIIAFAIFNIRQPTILPPLLLFQWEIYVKISWISFLGLTTKFLRLLLVNRRIKRENNSDGKFLIIEQPIKIVFLENNNRYSHRLIPKIEKSCNSKTGKQIKIYKNTQFDPVRRGMNHYKNYNTGQIIMETCKFTHKSALASMIVFILLGILEMYF